MPKPEAFEVERAMTRLALAALLIDMKAPHVWPDNGARTPRVYKGDGHTHYDVAMSHLHVPPSAGLLCVPTSDVQWAELWSIIVNDVHRYAGYWPALREALHRTVAARHDDPVDRWQYVGGTW